VGPRAGLDVVVRRKNPNIATARALGPWSRVLLEKLMITLIVKKFPALNGTRKKVQNLSTQVANNV
jgi:hypothetical protein